jgi:hypothetical protein
MRPFVDSIPPLPLTNPPHERMGLPPPRLPMSSFHPHQPYTQSHYAPAMSSFNDSMQAHSTHLVSQQQHHYLIPQQIHHHHHQPPSPQQHHPQMQHYHDTSQTVQLSYSRGSLPINMQPPQQQQQRNWYPQMAPPQVRNDFNGNQRVHEHG